jgi:uracil permease
VDFSEKRNLMLASVIMVLGVGGSKVHLGGFELDQMTLATLVGIGLNLLLPQARAAAQPGGGKGTEPAPAR